MNEIQIDYDDDALDVIDKVNYVLKNNNLEFVYDKNQEGEDYVVYKLKKLGGGLGGSHP